jgi:Asp-tRNA(Asn)/Glu-tRNA(Gln) amidotransferase A subunit family amidase
MPATFSAIATLRKKYLANETDPLTELNAALSHSNSNRSHNVYLAQDYARSCDQARNLSRDNIAHQSLWGIPVSLKDSFDLTAFPTTCGSTFYRDLHGIASTDSAIASRLRSAGAVLTGKTHLHQLAYGITGESRDFGDCLQPRDSTLLTGGSSSGAAASIQEGSALAAIGTDTGGSIRVPAALCGLAGYRSSITLNPPDLWRGGYHLAPTFDTIGWLYPHLADGPLLAHALFDLPFAPAPTVANIRIAIPYTSFLHDCDADILSTFNLFLSHLQTLGATISTFDASIWNDSVSIFAPIQASEAAALHAGHFHHFEPAIAERLAWGASFSSSELYDLHTELASFRASTHALFRAADYLLFPCAPMSALAAAADHTQTRARILRYTSPISLAGLPVVTINGLQLVGPLNSDATLIALSAALAANLPIDATLHP